MERKYWATSDLHLFHDRPFVWQARGFSSVEEMNKAIVEKWNSVVGENDVVYLLGDLMLDKRKEKEALDLLASLKGEIHIIRGNHDTDSRVAQYLLLDNVHSVLYADMVVYKKYRFYISHYPSFTGNLSKESLRQMAINLFGHTHQKENFYQELPFMYHVGVDSHDCTPVLLDDIIEECKEKYKIFTAEEENDSRDLS